MTSNDRNPKIAVVIEAASNQSFVLINANTLTKVTYLITPHPQPAIDVKSRGAKSRAGLIGAPQLNPKAKIMRPKSVTPMAMGTRPLGVFMFLLSVMAQIKRRKKETQTI